MLIKLLRVIINYPMRLFNQISWLAIIVESNISKNVSVGPSANVRYSAVGCYTYIGKRTNIAYTEIGRFCSIANDVSIGGGSHPINWVSTSPVFYKGRNILKCNFSSNEYVAFNKTIIGNDVWIGSRAMIKSGVKIGDGAIIGMGSIVTKDVEPYSIVAGNPAKLIRKRFDDKTISSLIKSRWWDWNAKELTEMGKHFNNTNNFITRIGEK